MRNCRKSYVKFGVGKMKIKNKFVIFQMLTQFQSNPNLTKLVNPTMLSFDCKA